MVTPHSRRGRFVDRAAPPFRTNSKGLKLDPHPLLELDGGVDIPTLETFNSSSVLHAAQFDKASVVAVAQAAALLETTDFSLRKPLDGKLVVTAFFEASTRTRLSFESAVLRLDGKVLSVPDGQVTGVKKGEALSDIGEMLNTYGDAVVMRHPETSALDEIRTNLTAPLINAGNGSGQHPTQALLDWYALLKWRPDLAADKVAEGERVHLGIIGTPGSMRSVNSFTQLALLFEAGIRKITIISEMADPFGATLAQRAQNSPMEIEVTNDLREVLSDLDVIYMNSIAFLGDDYKTLDSRFKLERGSPLKPGSVIMHPLARRDELDADLDESPHNLYFAQAAGAVFVRQAVLMAVLGRTGALSDVLKQQ
ncbi:MAG: aspartate carbamoyltransferase [Myxococcota bacterium]